jgi:hypothetical protein
MKKKKRNKKANTGTGKGAPLDNLIEDLYFFLGVSVLCCFLFAVSLF